MINCEGDNKNCFVFTFLSLLIEKKVFEIIEVGFLPVGTHMKTWVYISYFTNEWYLVYMWRTKSICSMFHWWIFYFRSFVEQNLFNGNAKKIGIHKCQYFRFMLIDDTLIMQYKVSLWDEKWSTSVHFWNSLPYGSVDFLVGRPQLLSL